MDCVVEVTTTHTTELKEPYTLNRRKVKISYTHDPIPATMKTIAEDTNLLASFGTSANVNR
jgi:hypothetical protein